MSSDQVQGSPHSSQRPDLIIGLAGLFVILLFVVPQLFSSLSARGKQQVAQNNEVPRPSQSTATAYPATATAYPAVAPTSIPRYDLGISRASVQSEFEQKEYGFLFFPGSEGQGQPQVVGMPRGKLFPAIELLGPPEDLTSATIVILPTSGTVIPDSIYLLIFLTLLVPDWQGSGEWLSTNLKAVASASGVAALRTAQHGNKKISLMTIKGPPFLITLAVERSAR